MSPLLRAAEREMIKIGFRLSQFPFDGASEITALAPWGANPNGLSDFDVAFLTTAGSLLQK